MANGVRAVRSNTGKQTAREQTGQRYQSGFGNELATEAVAGALPTGQNAPQQAPLGLYAEQLSGTAFTAPRALNRRSWVYRIRPSVMHKPYRRIDNGLLHSTPFDHVPATPNQLRWSPVPIPDKPTDFLAGLITLAGSGDLATHCGVAIHVYAANRGMEGVYCYNADGEMLLVPQMGRLLIHTELGRIELAPGEKSIRLTGYAASAPRVVSVSGAAAPVSYNSSTKIFTLTVRPRQRDDDDQVRQMIVVLDGRPVKEPAKSAKPAAPTQPAVPSPLAPPPPTTALGAILNHITKGAMVETFQPMNVNFGLFPEPPEERDARGRKIKGRERKRLYALRARDDLTAWITANPLPRDA